MQKITVTKCPVCGNDSSILHAQVEKIQEHRRVLCLHCNTIYFESLPENMPSYDAEYNLHFYRAGDIRKAGIMAAKIAELAINNFKDPEILEAGLGNGLIVWLLTQMRLKASGLDIDPAWTTHLQRHLGIQVYTSKFEDVNFNEKFDLIYSSHVIEHTAEPHVFFKAAYKALKKNGLFFIDTPDTAFWEITKTRWHHFSTRNQFEHICLLSKQAVKILAEANNFDFVGIKSYADYESMQILLRKG